MKVTAVENIQPLSKRPLAGDINRDKSQQGKNDSIAQGQGGNQVDNKGNIQPGEQQIIDAIEKANKSLGVTYTRFEFSIHEDTKEIMVKVIDEATDEVIREIPPEKILDMVARMWELVGLFIDEKI